MADVILVQFVTFLRGKTNEIVPTKRSVRLSLHENCQVYGLYSLNVFDTLLTTVRENYSVPCQPQIKLLLHSAAFLTVLHIAHQEISDVC